MAVSKGPALKLCLVLYSLTTQAWVVELTAQLWAWTLCYNPMLI